MHIVLLGASGQTGQQFLKQALARGHSVTALFRGATEQAECPGLRVRVADPLDVAQVREAAEGADALVSCVGIRKANPADPWSALVSPLDLTQRCAQAVVTALAGSTCRRVLMISSAGVGDSWSRLDPGLQAVIERSSIAQIFHDLGQMERVLASSALDTLAIRPVALVNGEATGQCGLVERFDSNSRITTGDVARWMLQALERPHPFEQRAEMIGSLPEPSAAHC